MSNYKKSGVDTKKAQNLLNKVKPYILETHQKNSLGRVINNFGSFAGGFQVKNLFSYSKNITVASTDGVGTKIELCKTYKFYDSIGFDLVAMCINDLYCLGAEPAFFLDYVVCEKLQDSWYIPVMKSIAKACKSISIPLLGGETAEHPKTMPIGSFDLAGFSIGFVHSKKMLPQTKTMNSKDLLIGIPSNGLHSNGFSLIRELLRTSKKKVNKHFIISEILKPTKIYSQILPLVKKGYLKGIAHITGGGLHENLTRILPPHLKPIIENQDYFLKSNEELFAWLLSFNLSNKELYNTFNMGIGMVLVAAPQYLSKIQALYPKVHVLGYLRNQKLD